MIHIVPHTKALERGVIDLILGIQRTEFGLDVGNDDPSDLLDVAGYYQTGAGNFWVALCGDAVVGTLGLRDIGQRQGALRKFYVKATHRGPGHTVAAQLLARLVQVAIDAQLHDLYLATTERFAAALRFYEKNGFTSVTLAQLPEAFPRIPQETRFYHRVLMAVR